MNRGASGSGFVAVGVFGGVRWQVPNDPFCYRGDGGRTAGGGGGAVECCRCGVDESAEDGGF